MLKLILIFFILLSGLAKLNAQWENCDNRLYATSIKDIAIQNDTIIVCTYRDGLFVSTDYGNNWTQKNHGLPSSNILSFKSYGKDLYIGIIDGGLFHSSDLGKNWTFIKNGKDLDYITDIAFTDNYLIVISGSTFNISFDKGNTWSKRFNGKSIYNIALDSNNIYSCTSTGKIYYSTDNGLIWDMIFDEPDINFISSINVSDNEIIVSTNKGIFISTDKTNSFSWKKFNYGLENIQIEKLYSQNGIYYAVSSLGNIFYCSSNNNNWKEVDINSIKNEIHDNSKVADIISIAIGKNNNIFVGPEDKGLFLTTDNGKNWIEKNSGILHPSRNFYVKNNTKNLLATDGYFIFLSTNYGDSWIRKQIDSNNYHQIDDINCFDGDFYLISNDTLFKSDSKGENWKQLNKEKLPQYSSEIYVNEKTMFIGTYENGLYKSTDKGLTWQESNNGINNYNPRSIVFEENNIFLGTYKGLYLSTDKGKNWNKINSEFENFYVTSIVINTNEIYIGTYGNGLYISSDTGKIWSHINIDLDLKTKTINSLLIYENYIFVGTNLDGVIVSTDKGNSWLKQSKELEYHAIFSLNIIDNYIFAGTDRGIYRAKLSDFKTTEVLQEDNSKSNILIYPNPAGDYIEVTLRSKGLKSFIEIANVRIFDMLGNEVISTLSAATATPQEGNFRVDITALRTGVYYLRTGNEVKMFVKE